MQDGAGSAIAHAPEMRRRCTECRKSFEVVASAIATQCVCGARCRSERDRKLARKRRLRELVEMRGEERDRQRASRARRSLESGCHAPPSAPKELLSRGEVGKIVDQALALSRGTLVRDLRGVLRRYARDSGDPEGLSRVSLGRQVMEGIGDSAAAVEARHA